MGSNTINAYEIFVLIFFYFSYLFNLFFYKTSPDENLHPKLSKQKSNKPH